MKNFPSTLIKQQNTKNGIGSNWKDTLSNIGSQALGNIFGHGGATKSSKDIDKEFAEGYERPELENMISEYNIMSNTQIIDDIEFKRNSQVSLYYNSNNGKSDLKDGVSFEDPFKLSSSIFSVINNYKYMFASSIPSILEGTGKMQKGDEKSGITVMETAAAPSLFNPYNAVQVNGIVENMPLMDKEYSSQNGVDVSIDLGEGDHVDNKKSISLNSTLFSKDKDITDCSIKKLVSLSKNSTTESSPLGLATYRYVDFMYCKDLGKIPNNRLITLRKFPGPIGDNIFSQAYPRTNNETIFKSYPDIGRLITWFDNEDNKLEDICKYDYEATWKEFTSEIQIETSIKQQDEGFVNRLANLFSPQNNILTGKGFSSNNGALYWGANLLHIPILSGERAKSQYYDWETLGNYDKHRIYEPPNRIWDTHKYEGRLKFNQEINLTFRYTLRSYDNINPKSAFLDLLGNIMVVTYRRGSFWGGESRIIGPQGSNSVYNTADAWIDWSFNKLGGIWNHIMNGNFDANAIQGWLSNMLSMANEGFNKAVEGSQKILNQSVEQTEQQVAKGAEKAVEKVQEGMKYVTEADKQFKFTDALKGMIKNQLGRPAIYAMNSLLTGENVGPWHLTIGNPRNPIMSMGNLIMTRSEVTHTGPLGIDDFPTELIVKVTLKHARPRDAVEIQKMYTKGLSAIYHPMNLVDIKKYWTNDDAFPDVIPFASDSGIVSDILSRDANFSPRPQTGGSTQATGPNSPWWVKQMNKVEDKVLKRQLSSV